MKKYTIGINDDGMRISRFVEKVTQGLPSSVLHKSFRNKRIKINGKHAPQSALLAKGDLVSLYLNDEFFSENKPKFLHKTNNLPHFETEFENKSLAILFKPAGVLCHSDAKNTATLLDAFTERLILKREYNWADENTFAPALCNRLDQGTEGLVIAAKRAIALREINQLMRLNQIKKTYLCVCSSRPPQGIFNAFLIRDKNIKSASISSNQSEISKEICTEIKILEEFKGLCLCEVQLHTGRTHQIRAHLAYLGSPILGDVKYGNHSANNYYNIGRQLLCAHQLCFSSTIESPTLSPLSGKCFTASYANLPLWWQTHKKTKTY